MSADLAAEIVENTSLEYGDLMDDDAVRTITDAWRNDIISTEALRYGIDLYREGDTLPTPEDQAALEVLDVAFVGREGVGESARETFDVTVRPTDGAFPAGAVNVSLGDGANRVLDFPRIEGETVVQVEVATGAEGDTELCLEPL